MNTLFRSLVIIATLSSLNCSLFSAHISPALTQEERTGWLRHQAERYVKFLSAASSADLTSRDFFKGYVLPLFHPDLRKVGNKADLLAPYTTARCIESERLQFQVHDAKVGTPDKPGLGHWVLTHVRIIPVPDHNMVLVDFCLAPAHGEEPVATVKKELHLHPTDGRIVLIEETFNEIPPHARAALIEAK